VFQKSDKNHSGGPKGKIETMGLMSFTLSPFMWQHGEASNAAAAIVCK